MATAPDLVPVTLTDKLTSLKVIGNPVGPPAPPSGLVEFVNVTTNQVIKRVAITTVAGGWQATVDTGFDSTVKAMQTVRATYAGDAYWNGVSTTFDQKVGAANT